MNALQRGLDDYLQLRRAMGYQLAEAHRLLPRFVSWMDHTGQHTMSIAAALEWCQLPKADPGSTVWPKRMTAVRGFARFMAGRDPDTQIPPVGLLPHRRHWRTPYIYSADDVASLMRQATISLDPRLPARTYATAIGLLAAAGLRIGELINLNRVDVDWQHATLLIRESKFAKTRIVPLTDTTMLALQDYAAFQDALHAPTKTSAFFLTITGKRLIYATVGTTFRMLCTQTAVGAQRQRPPRLHDLRHTFAVNTLVRWYRQGLNVHAKMPYLSAYLGHRDPTSTYWYLSAAPELLALAADRIEDTTSIKEQQS